MTKSGAIIEVDMKARTHKPLSMLLALAFVLQVGCATEPGETTGIGALAGGVLGAGLGVIVGSQTGDPGAGLALGTAAGTAAGAIFGNELQARQEDLEAQDELLRRQEDTLKAQQKQLEELRTLESDSNYSAPFRPSARGSLSRDWKAPNSQKSGFDTVPRRVMPEPSQEIEKDRRTPQVSRVTETVEEQTLIEETSSEVVQEALPSETSESSDADPTSEDRPSRIFSPLGSEPLVAAVDQAGEETSSETVVLEDKPVEALESDAVDPEAQKVKEYMRSAGQVGLSKECEMAQEEVVKADDASEEAEKLFHYRRALRMCPENPAVHTSLGDIYKQSGRSEDAKYEYKQALKISPNYAPALERLKELDKK